MKTASGIIALILGLLTLLNIAGCSKAQKEYDDFVAYSNSTRGGMEGFMRGWSSGSRGDPFGAALDIADQERSLISGAKDARWSAWACLVGTVLASVVCAAIPSKKSAMPLPITPASSSVRTPMPPAIFRPQHSIEERLRTLLQLQEAGLISDDEYQTRSREIIGQI